MFVRLFLSVSRLIPCLRWKRAKATIYALQSLRQKNEKLIHGIDNQECLICLIFGHRSCVFISSFVFWETMRATRFATHRLTKFSFASLRGLFHPLPLLLLFWSPYWWLFSGYSNPRQTHHQSYWIIFFRLLLLAINDWHCL